MKKKTTEKKWYVFLKLFFVVMPMLALAIQLLILMANSASDNIESIMESIKKFAIPMGIEILVFSIAKYIDTYFIDVEKDKDLQQIQQDINELSVSVKQIQTITTTIEGKAHDTEQRQEGIEKSINDVNRNIHYYNNASIEILSTYDDFYTRLKKSRQEAKREVLLTQLDPWPPDNYEDESVRKSYFAGDVEYLRQHPNISVYRILSIESKDKLLWVKELIEQTKDCSNFFIAYINIDSIEKSVPFPKMLSFQIIDGEEVFCLNPQFSYMPRAYKPCYYFKNRDVAKLYVDYYKKIWDTLCEKPEHGCILKEGRDTANYEIKLSKIRSDRGWSE